MSLKYWILIMFGTAICSRSSAQFCSRRYVDGKWTSKGDCGGTKMMSEIMSELQRRAEEEKKWITDRQWTVFQRRKLGNVDFFQDWDDYVNGFGTSDGDFWLGLEKLHEMTKDGNMELQINMIKKNTGVHMVANYRDFRIRPASDFYRLRVFGYSGNATIDPLAYHNNQRFSTKDADHDGSSSLNCASGWEGGWWYRSCANSNLNGNFDKARKKGFYLWDGSTHHYLSFSEMKLKRRL